MSSANNTDLFGMVSRIFNPPPTDAAVLAELEAKDGEMAAVVASAMAVHGALGHGFLPAVYRQALAIEFEERGIAHTLCPEITLNYKGRALETGYQADFICQGDILVLIASVLKFEHAHDLQLINHLKCTGLRRGLYLNFGFERVEFRRVVGPAPGATP